MNNELFYPKGIYSAMITPFDEDGNVNIKEVKRIIEFLISKNVNGVFPVSNVGEFLLLKSDDKRAIIKAVVEQATGRLKIIPGICEVSIEESISLANYSKEVGADGVVLCAPYYYPYSQEYIKEYIEAIADESPLPIILYNSPGFTNKFDYENLVEICKHPNITAMKESSGDIKLLLRLITRFKNENIDTKVLVGWEELLYTGLTLGAEGCVTSCGGIVPELLNNIYNEFAKGNHGKALEYQKMVVEITEEIGKIGFPHGYKLGVLARGFDFKIYNNPRLNNQENEILKHLEHLKSFINKRLEKIK